MGRKKKIVLDEELKENIDIVEKKADKKRYYNFNVVIYEDDENFKEQFNLIKDLQEAIWCRHDKDTKEDSEELKKAHYHVVIKLKTNCTISALAKKINVKENMIEPVKKSLNGCLKYLIHYGYDDKYNYEIDDVESNSENLKRRFLDLVTKSTPEVDKVIFIQDFIDNFQDYIKISVLSKYAQKNNIWDVFRRNYSIIKDLTNEHNAKISGDRYGYKYTNEEYYNASEDI